MHAFLKSALAAATLSLIGLGAQAHGPQGFGDPSDLRAGGPVHPWADTRIDARQARQQDRIHRAWTEGTLSRHEYRQLQREQRLIRHAEARARADGRLTPHERVRLEALQDRASRHIRLARLDDGPR